MLHLYNAALLPLRAAVAVWAALPGRSPAKRAEWAERRARRLPAIRPGGVWLHGASVGEARIVSALARALRSERPLLPLAVSAYTPTGRAQLPSAPAADAAFYLPLDFPGLPRRVLEAVRPEALAIVETELWPNLLDEALAAAVRVVVLNGRLSAGRMARYRRLSRLYRPLLERIPRVGVRSDQDAARFVELGATPAAVVVTGNVKYDLPRPAVDADRLRRRLGLDRRRPVFVAGSTGKGEEIPVLDAFERVRAWRKDLLLVLAPRHPVRVDEVERLVRSRNLATARLSAAGRRADDLDVVIVDTVGELAGLYQLAWVAFVGGSLVSVGGHNVLEPAAVGVPVLFGPHTENFAEPVAALEQAGGGRRVRDAAELAEALRTLVDDDGRRSEAGRRAESVVRANRGALARSVSLLLSALEEPVSRAGAGTP